MEIELSVGTEVVINGITYKVEYCDACKECGFNPFNDERDKDGLQCRDMICQNYRRKDRNSVIFVKSNK